MTWHLDTAATAAAVGLVSGALVPALIARVPEPKPLPRPGDDGDVNDIAPAADEQEYSRPVDAAKEPYAEVARLAGLRWKCALACAFAAGFVGARVGWHPALLFLLYLVPVCAALSVIDWRTRYLPTWLIGPSYVVVGVLAVVAAAATSDWGALRGAAIGWLGTFALFWVVWFLVPRAWSYGDVRLAGVLGMALGWLGPGPLVIGVWSGFVLGGVCGLALSRLRVFHHSHVPLGPFLAVGAWVGVVWWSQLGAAYTSLVAGTAG